MLWNATVVSVLERQRQYDQEFKANFEFKIGAQPALRETLV